MGGSGLAVSESLGSVGVRELVWDRFEGGFSIVHVTRWFDWCRSKG